MMSQEDNLLIQSYISVVLLAELGKNKFFKSDYFKNMPFDAPWVKEELGKVGPDNQGTALMALYAMLVIPRQLAFNKYPDVVKELSEFLVSKTQKTASTYVADKPNVNFLLHVRNAVAHARVTFRESDAVVFADRSKSGETFVTELPLSSLGQFMEKLQMIHLRHIGLNQPIGYASSTARSSRNTSRTMCP